jgi:hypothetical protein
MAKKAKKAKSKKSFTFKSVPVSHYHQTLKALRSGKAPNTSGELIRARLVEGKMTADAIVAEVHKRFKDSSAKRSDVYWNRGRLKKEGVKLADMPKAEKPAKKGGAKAAKKSKKAKK